MALIIILAISIFLQFTAAVLSLRLIKITGKWWAWSFIASALVLMGCRRVITFYDLLSGKILVTPHITTELVALGISLLMVLGVILIGPLFRSLNQTNKALLIKESSINNVNDAIYWADKNFHILDVNKAASRMLGYSRNELLNMQVNRFDPEFSPEKWEDLKNTRHMVYETQQITRDGTPVPVEVTASYFNFDNEEYIFLSCHDIARRKKSRENIVRFYRIFEDSLNEIFLFDEKTLKFVQANKAAMENLGYSSEEFYQLTPVDIKPDFTRESFEKLITPLRTGEKKKITFETVHRRKDNSLYNVEVHLQLLQQDNESLFAAIILDITDRKKVHQQLSYQSSHDSLTGLINRHEFERRCIQLLSTTRDDNSEHALCIMDLDQFKVVNDTSGHIAGDEILRQIGALLIDIVRQRDTLARLGGDEFGVLMEHCSIDDARRVARNIQKVVEDYQFVWEDKQFKISVSMGLVPITKNTTDYTELLKDADVACFMAKDKGRNRIHVHDPDDIEVARHHGEIQWVTRINQALEQNLFCLFVQRIQPLDDSQKNHYEILIRMKNENGELIPPGSFLPAAERYNLISKIDNWVIKNAIELLLANPELLEHTDLFSINLSGQSLANPDFLNSIVNILDETKINAEKICFEVTETAAITNIYVARKFISVLKGLGCSFSLDDFGSGLSSFGYLKNLPVDYLKIDGMFVKDITSDSIDHAMVNSINQIGQVMGMKTIAEFVENDAIKELLKKIGVNFVQGFGVSKPVSFNTLIEDPGYISVLENISGTSARN